MTERQKRFCDEYLIDCNAAQAAIRAGYSEKYAHTNANKLLQITTIKSYITERLEKIKSERTADAQEVMEYLTSVMRGETTASEIVVEGTGDGCSEARLMEKPPGEKDKLKAAELLGKRYAMFTDKVEETVDMELNVTVDYGDDSL